MTILSVILYFLFYVALPALIIWLIFRAIRKRDNARKEIILSALEKNPQSDVESIVRAMETGGKSIKKTIVSKLTWGCIICIIGNSFLLVGLWKINLSIKTLGGYNPQFDIFLLVGGILIAVGVAFVVNFFVSRKLMEKEIKEQEIKDQEILKAK